MSIQVNDFDVKKAKAELQNCPEIVKIYVNLLEQSSRRWENIASDALSKLKNITKNNI